MEAKAQRQVPPDALTSRGEPRIPMKRASTSPVQTRLVKDVREEEKEEQKSIDENGKDSTTTDENNDANKDDKNEGDNKDDTQTGNSENVGGDETKENKVEDDAGSNKTEDAPEIEDNLKKAEEGENPDSNKE